MRKNVLREWKSVQHVKYHLHRMVVFLFLSHCIFSNVGDEFNFKNKISCEVIVRIRSAFFWGQNLQDKRNCLMTHGDTSWNQKFDINFTLFTLWVCVFVIWMISSQRTENYREVTSFIFHICRKGNDSRRNNHMAHLAQIKWIMRKKTWLQATEY